MNQSIEVRLLANDEAAVLDRLAPEVFDFDINDRYSAEFFADPRHHLAVALSGDLVVGMASAVHYLHPDKPNELWINEIGVSPEYRNRGIGRQLLGALFAHARDLGCKAAWVLTDEDNVPARRLYAAIGGSAQSTVYITFDL